MTSIYSSKTSDGQIGAKSSDNSNIESTQPSAEATSGTSPEPRSHHQHSSEGHLGHSSSSDSTAPSASDTYCNGTLPPALTCTTVVRQIEPSNLNSNVGTEHPSLISKSIQLQSSQTVNNGQNDALLSHTGTGRTDSYDLQSVALPEYPAQMDEFMETLHVADPSVSPAQIDYQTTCENSVIAESMDLNRFGLNLASHGRLTSIQESLYPSSRTSTEADGSFFDMCDVDMGDLESRFEQVIRAVEDAGFESIDDMSTQYYTGNFREDSISFEAQSRSRRRSLHTFLQALHSSAGHWSSREVQGYRHQLIGAAENLYIDEFLNAQRSCSNSNTTDYRKASMQGLCPPQPKVGALVSRLWQTMAELNLVNHVQERKRFYRDEVCEILIHIHWKAQNQSNRYDYGNR